MSTLSSARDILHRGAPLPTQIRARSLAEISLGADEARRRGDRGLASIEEMVGRHFDDVHVKAAAIERLCRTRWWVDLPDPLVAAGAINLRALPRRMRTGRRRWLEKPNGGRRLVCSPSWPLRVAQMLANEVIVAAHQPAAHVGDWPGRGPKYHLTQLLTDLRRGSVVILADVQDCFQSVQPDAVYGLGLFPSDVVRSCLDVRRIRLRAPYGSSESSTGCTFERTGRHGLLCGGSASSAMWAMMIDDLPGVLPADVRAHTYVDNVVIVCGSVPECDDAEAAITRYFTEHPAGPFFLTIARVEAGSGFTHLGYDMTVRGDDVVVAIKESRLSRISDRLDAMLASSTEPISEPERPRIVDQLLAPWPMISPSTRDAMADVIQHECVLYNQRLGARVLDDLEQCASGLAPHES